ncbi:hypothetical protein HCB38_07545 [Listeria sp. FSL L7-0083]|uniref:hypothetical protein n=1 Tax=Listeria farberi TaxID=2713500 RepID=UPI00162407FB|nr:hypothetical protein [Listeria farberi]MBC2267663.1 hypothetical protein [Listeria farberi]
MEKAYWYNEGTNTLLTEKEYKDLMEREAKELYEEVQEEEKELESSDKTSFEEFLKTCYENESDFVISDSEGNKLEEW